MTTITIKNGKKLTRTQFENLEDLQEYLIAVNVEDEFEFTDTHKKILDNRLKEADINPTNFITFDELKTGLTRKNV